MRGGTILVGALLAGCSLIADLGPLSGDGGVPTDAGSEEDAVPDVFVVPLDAATLTAISIPTLRDPTATDHPKEGQFVKVVGGVITGVKSTGSSHGFFVQDPIAKKWAGVYAFTGNLTIPLAIGAVVTVIGTFGVYRGLDQIDLTGAGSSYELTGSDTVPYPLDVTPNAIRDGSSTAAQYQSMILRVKLVIAKTKTLGLDFVVTSSVGNDDLDVTSFMASDVGPSQFPAIAGQTYTSIVGRGYRFGLTEGTSIAKLAPMSAAEVTTP